LEAAEDIEKRQRILARTPLFQHVEKRHIQDIATKSLFKSFKNKQEIFALNDKAHSFFLIIEGWVKLYRMTREGEEAIINVFAPGETFAEAAVFSSRQVYPVNAQAVEKTEVLEIPRTLFVNKIKEDSDFALHILGSISARQHSLIQQIEQVTVKSAPQRIGAFLLRLCPPEQTSNIAVELPYDKSLIARRLNIQPETFSRALAKLKPYGVVQQGRQIIVMNTEKLSDFCDIDDRDKPC